MSLNREVMGRLRGMSTRVSGLWLVTFLGAVFPTQFPGGSGILFFEPPNMEGSDLIQNIIRNIICEVLRECKNHYIYMKSEFLSYYIKLLQLDPNRGLTAEYLTNREKVQQFVKDLVGKLENPKDPQIITLYLQYEFITHFGDLEHTVKEFRKKLDTKLYPLLLEIIEQHRQSTADELYRKITYYVTLASGLGNPAHKPVFKEVMQVIKSILEREEIEIFPSLQHYIKQEMVKCLVDISTGIRLYNKECKKGGEEIPNLTDLVEEGIKAVQIKLENCIEITQKRAKQMTNFLEKHMYVKPFKEDFILELNFNTPEEKTKYEYIRDMTVAYMQLIKIIRMLLEYITTMENNRKRFKETFQTTIKYLHGIIIPTLYQAITEVFPYFSELAGMWREFQDAAVRLKEVFSIFLIQWNSIVVLGFDFGKELESPLKNWLETRDDPFINPNPEMKITVHENTERFTEKDLEFNGFCCYVLTHTGVLLPGNLDLGIVEYQEKYYSFSSKLAANAFAKRPHEFIMKAIEMARKRIYLIKFLNLMEFMQDHVHIKVLVKKKKKAKVSMCHAQVQTDTHFHESNRDPAYSWNIWNYKKSLIISSNLTNKRTKMTETEKTYQTESNHTQTYKVKNSETQTTRENYTNTARHLNYFYGLRGIRKNYPFVMNLSEPRSCSELPINFK